MYMALHATQISYICGAFFLQGLTGGVQCTCQSIMAVLKFTIVVLRVCITGDKLLVSGRFYECDSIVSKVDDVLYWLPLLESLCSTIIL